jgi:hypothetical protein
MAEFKTKVEKKKFVPRKGNIDQCLQNYEQMSHANWKNGYN